MFLWVSFQDTRYCTIVTDQGTEIHYGLREYFFRLATSFVQIFCYLNIVEGHTRLRCTVYYTVVFAENFAMVLIFYISASVSGSPGAFDLTVVLFSILGFAGGIVLMVFYYKVFHPNHYSYLHEDRVIRWWVPLKDLAMCYDPTWNLEELDRQAERENLNPPLPVASAAKGPPGVKFLRPILRNPSSGSECSSRSNFIQKPDLDAESKAKLNLKYSKPAKIDDILNESKLSHNESTV